MNRKGREKNGYKPLLPKDLRPNRDVLNNRFFAIFHELVKIWRTATIFRIAAITKDLPFVLLLGLRLLVIQIRIIG